MTRLGWFSITCLVLLLLLPSSSPTIAQQVSDDQNFRNCLNGWYPCSVTRLTSEQRVQVEARERERNYRNCLNGWYPCSVTRLTSEQRVQVEARERERNYRNCLNGWYPCNAGMLTGEQIVEVEIREVDRNYRNCLTGLYPCNSARLVPQQRASVSAAQQYRNYYNCLTFGTGSLCDIGRLTSHQKEAVNYAQRQRSASLLPGQLRVVVHPPTLGGKPQTVSQGVSICAENGSCLGDISVATGRPKTVYVRGYYRSNGTYVRSHFRSSPRR